MIRKLMASSAVIALMSAGAIGVAQAQTDPAKPAIVQDNAAAAVPDSNAQPTTQLAESKQAITPDHPTPLQLSLDAPGAPVMVMGDETRLAQVFSNLIHNATKFTQPNGEIRISVAREPTQAVVVVSDNGVGIEASMLERVFHAFEQVSGAEKRGGLGVGLTLARRIVELHGGSISASSDGAGAGSTFTMRLQWERGLRRCIPSPILGQ